MGFKGPNQSKCIYVKSSAAVSNASKSIEALVRDVNLGL